MHRRLDDFLAQGLAGRAHGQELLVLVRAIADAVRAVSATCAKGWLVGQAGGPNIGPDALTTAAQEQASTAFFDAVSGTGVADLIFSSNSALAPGPEQRALPLKAAITALEGSANFAFNASAGSIFGVWPSNPWPPDASADASASGCSLIAAGYAIYGPATLFVLSVGDGVQCFTLDRESDSFLLTHPGLQIPDAADEFAIDMGRERLWESPVRRYITECKLGRGGYPRPRFSTPLERQPRCGSTSDTDARRGCPLSPRAGRSRPPIFTNRGCADCDAGRAGRGPGHHGPAADCAAPSPPDPGTRAIDFWIALRMRAAGALPSRAR